jgi:hypothetical protein
LAAALSAPLGCGNVDPSAQSHAGSGGDGAASAGAGADSSDAGSPNADSLEPLLPWAVGNSWTYQVTKSGVISTKITTIGDLEKVGGTGPNAELMAYHVVTMKGVDSKDKTESWQAPSPANRERIVRYREQSFDEMTGLLSLEEHWEPEKLRIDGSADRTVSGASWLEMYTETKLEVNLNPVTHDVREVWSVIDDDETLEVPAGTFEHVVHLQKSGGGANKDYWYLRGVGKLKETGSQTEQLVEYSLEAAP